MDFVMLSHKTVRKSHERAVVSAGRRVAVILISGKTLVAAVDLLAAFAAAILIPGPSASGGERVALAFGSFVLVPVAAWVIGTGVLTPFVLVRQRDYARMERDWYRLRSPDGKNCSYGEVASLIRWHVNEGKRLSRRTYVTRHPGEVRSDVLAWHGKLRADLNALPSWAKDWGDPGKPDFGRSAVRRWLREQLNRLQGFV